MATRELKDLSTASDTPEVFPLVRVRHRWILFVPSVVPALATLVVGQLRMARPYLGWDERATWSVAERTPAQIFDLGRHTDGVILPYYFFEH